MHLLNNRLGRITALIALGGAALYSQGTQTANVSGTVVDAAGAPIAGVVVRLTSPSLQGVRTYSTDAAGKFIARLLPPGFYTIQYTKDGLETRKISEPLGIDQTFSPKVTLSKVGGAVVEVIAAAPAVDKTDIKTATNYRMDTVDQLPTANRTMETVALLTPGVTAGVGGRVQIRGAMTSGNLYLLDGQNIADNAYNNRGVRTIDDAIEETQVVTGAMSAEYGDVEGGVINSITRSGGNEFSGSLRWELQNPAWNASRPTENRATALSNILGEEKTLFLSGPILKDTLWFAASYFKTDRNTALSITANLTDAFGLWPAQSPGATALNLNGPGGLNSGYQQGTKEVRRQAKLTWALNQDHTLIASFMNATINDTNRNYSAGELKSLVPQISTSEFYNVTARSAWTTNFTTELKFGRKKQNLSAGGAANGQSPFYNDDNGFFYNNGIFNNTDGGDERDNRTYNLKASLFWNAAGNHQTDFGVDYYQGTRKAKNEQTPTGYIIEVAGLTLNPASQYPSGTTVGANMAWGGAIWVYQSGTGQADNFSTGLYVNDKWTVDQNWNFQLGVRFDNYKAKNEGGNKTAGASGISPRIGTKYDFFGDSKHILGLSWARYNAKVLEGITNSVTSQGNPTEIDYAYSGPGGPQNFATLQNVANYDYSPAGVLYYNDPTLNVKLNDKLKAPTVDEIQLNYAYSFNVPALGDGFVKVTAVSKKWKNLIDYSVGNNGTVSTPTGPVYMKIWDNNPDAKREYKSLEVEGQLNRNGWNYGGNITWSSLKGNYEGEGTSTPARGEGIHAFDVQNGVQLFNSADTSPYGYLFGHDPLRMRLNGNRSFTNAYGKTAVGLIYRFDSGAHYSHTRSISPVRLGGPTLSGQFGTTGTQYMDQTRGAGVFRATAYLDAALTHDFPLFKVMGKDVTAFGKIVMQNVLNHQQVASFSTAYSAATGVYGTPTGGVNSPWVRSSSFGQPTSASGSYGLARTVTASAGFRF